MEVDTPSFATVLKRMRLSTSTGAGVGQVMVISCLPPWMLREERDTPIKIST